MKCTSIILVIIRYTSLVLSGCRSYQDVTALDRSWSPKFTIT